MGGGSEGAREINEGDEGSKKEGDQGIELLKVDEIGLLSYGGGL